MAESRDPDRELVRYMRLSRLMQWFSNRKLALSSPAEWHDAIEDYWFTVLHRRAGVDPKRARRQVFGACFTVEYYSEAFWKRFGDHDDIVRVTLDRDALLGAVASWCATHGAVMVSGEVGYAKVLELGAGVLASADAFAGLEPGSEAARRHLLQPWLGKANAFAFEREWRVLVHVPEPLPDGARPWIDLAADERSLVKVMLDHRIDKSLRLLVRSHLRQSIPKLRMGVTIVNRVPTSLQRFIEEATPAADAAP